MSDYRWPTVKHLLTGISTMNTFSPIAIPKQITIDIINVMTYGGTNPFDTSMCQKIIAYFHVVMLAFIVTFMAINLYVTPYDSVGDIVSDLIICVGFVQVGAKYYTAAQHKSILSEMIKTTWNDFWNLESVHAKIKADILNLYRKTSIITFVYVSGTIAAVISIILRAFFSKSFIMDLWLPNKEQFYESPYYEIIFTIQCIIVAEVSYVGVAQIDKLFIVMIVLVYVQFKLIKVKILSIGNSQSKNDFTLLRDSIIHHNRLLKFVTGFESVYSRLFLPTVGTNVILATICMWGFITEEVLSNKFMCIAVYFTVMSQVLSYCIAGQIIQDAGTNLAHAAYHCNWTNVHDYKIRMGLIMIMSQSTRKIQLSVGGIMVLCMESFAALSRASFSFLAFIVNVRD